jgi:hypothetical protein
MLTWIRLWFASLTQSIIIRWAGVPIKAFAKIAAPHVCIDGKRAALPKDFGSAKVYMQMRQALKYRSVFGNNEIDTDYERSEEGQPFDPDAFSRREVNARQRQHAKGDRDWLFSY